MIDEKKPFKIKAKIWVSDEFGNEASFDETNIKHIELEDPPSKFHSRFVLEDI